MTAKNFSKVDRHPDKEEITKRFMEGESVRSVQKWLASKYAQSSKHNKLSAPTLQTFRKEVLKIDGEVLKDIQTAKKEEDKQLEAEYIAQVAKNTNAYKEKINQIADKHLDVATKIIQLDAVIGDRIEHWYNVLKSEGELPQKADNELRKYIDQQLEVLTSWKKLVEGMADKRVDYNVSITVMNEQVQIIQGAIRELVFEELGLDKINRVYGEIEQQTQFGFGTKAVTRENTGRDL